MKLAFVIASIFALGLTLVSGKAVSARGYGKGNKDSCGNGTVVQNSTIATYNGYPIGFVEATCPLYCEGNHYAKRDGYYCTQEYCYLTCTDVIDCPIYSDDCAPILEYLASFGSGSFYIPAETYYEWYYGSCTIVYWNFDCYEYEVCYEAFAFDAGVSADTCLGSTYGAVCEGSGEYGDNYAIVIA